MKKFDAQDPDIANRIVEENELAFAFFNEVVCQRLRHFFGTEGFNFAWNEGGEVAG